MTDKLTISKARNGWILKFMDENSIGDKYLVTLVFEEKETRESEVETFMDLLRTVNDLMGPSYDGFNKHNVSVVNVVGDEIDDEEVVDES